MLRFISASGEFTLLELLEDGLLRVADFVASTAEVYLEHVHQNPIQLLQEL